MIAQYANSPRRMARHYHDLGQQIARARVTLTKSRSAKSRIESDIDQLDRYCRDRQRERDALFLRMMNAMSHRRFCRLMGI